MKSSKTLLLGIVAVFGSIVPVHSIADDCVNEAECTEIGKWNFALGVGLGAHENPIEGEDNVPIVLLPSWSYYGERFFVEDFTLGYTLFDSDSQQINAVLSTSYDQMYFSDWSLGNFSLGGDLLSGGSGASPQLEGFRGSLGPDTPVNDELDESPAPDPNPSTGDVDRDQNSDPTELELADRSVAVLGGLEYLYSCERFSFGFSVLQDLSDVHRGQEARLAGAYRFGSLDNAISLTAGLTWQSAKWSDYYYGISARDTEVDALHYKVGSSLSPFIRLGWQKKLSTRWVLLSSLHVRDLDDRIANSPITDKNSVMSAFIGGVYHF